VQFISSSPNVSFNTGEEEIILSCTNYESKQNVLLESPEGPIYINEEPYYKIEAKIKVKLPSMGYTVVSFNNSVKTLSHYQPKDSSSISNNFCTITINNNQLSLTANGKVFNNFLSFEDCGNDGDTYDFSPLRGDKAIKFNLKLDKCYSTKHYEQMVLDGNFTLPKTLDDRLNNKDSGTLKLKLKLTLSNDSPLIQANLLVDNQIESHRLRLLFNAGAKLSTSYASLPFAFIKKQAQQNKIEELPQGYVEMPIDIEVFEGSVAVPIDDCTLNFIGGSGLKEYQLIDSHLAITLMSTTGQLGKANLVYRPGRASGDTTKKGHIMMPTPSAQLLGEQNFNFAFFINSGNFDAELLSRQEASYNAQDISYQMQTLNKFINRLDNKIHPSQQVVPSPRQFSLIEADSSLLLSSFSPSLYHNNSFLLRFKNPTASPQTIKLPMSNYFAKIEKVNFAEERCPNQNMIIDAYNAITLKCTLKDIN
jgi:alpha-mannosidase